MAAIELSRSAPSFPFIFEYFFKPWNERMDSRLMYDWQMTVPLVSNARNRDFYNVSWTAPVLKKERFIVDLEDNRQTKRTKKEEAESIKENHYTRREYSYNSIACSFTLPEGVNKEQLEAYCENGMLELKRSKKEKARNTAATKHVSVK